MDTSITRRGQLIGLAIAAGGFLAAAGLSGCEEPGEAPASAVEQTPEPAPASAPERRERQGFGQPSPSLGGAKRAGERLGDRVEDRDRQLQEEIEDLQGGG